MTCDTQDERFPAHGNHDSFPQFFALYVFQLPHMMDFKISPLFATVLALVRVESLNKFAPASHQGYTRSGFDIETLPAPWCSFKVLQ